MKAKWLMIPAAAAILVSGSIMAAGMPPLAKKAGCTACHSIGVKIVGPAWKDIAAAYKGQDASAALIKKIEKGGKSDRWKEISNGVPMPPYGNKTTAAERAELVKFILAL